LKLKELEKAAKAILKAAQVFANESGLPQPGKSVLGYIELHLLAEYEAEQEQFVADEAGAAEDEAAQNYGYRSIDDMDSAYDSEDEDSDNPEEARMDAEDILRDRLFDEHKDHWNQAVENVEKTILGHVEDGTPFRLSKTSARYFKDVRTRLTRWKRTKKYVEDPNLFHGVF